MCILYQCPSNSSSQSGTTWQVWWPWARSARWEVAHTPTQGPVARATSQGEHIPWQNPDIVGQGCLLLSLSPGVTAGRKCPQGRRRRGRKPNVGLSDTSIWSPSSPEMLMVTLPHSHSHIPSWGLDNWKLALESSG